MPISNPIIQGLTVNQYITQGTDLTMSNIDPFEAPSEIKRFWFNYAARNLFLAIATNAVSDWIAIGGSPEWVDIKNKPDLAPDIATILNKIVVQDGQVLTTDDNVIFED